MDTSRKSTSEIVNRLQTVYVFLMSLETLVVLFLIPSIMIVGVGKNSGTIPPQTAFATFCAWFGFGNLVFAMMNAKRKFLGCNFSVSADLVIAIMMFGAGIWNATTLGIHSIKDEDFNRNNVIIKGALSNSEVSLQVRAFFAQAATGLLISAAILLAGRAIVKLIWAGKIRQLRRNSGSSIPLDTASETSGPGTDNPAARDPTASNPAASITQRKETSASSSSLPW